MRVPVCYFLIHVEVTLTTFDGPACMLVEGNCCGGDSFLYFSTLVRGGVGWVIRCGEGRKGGVLGAGLGRSCGELQPGGCSPV